MMTTDLKM